MCPMSMEGKIWKKETFWGWKRRMMGWWMIRVVMMTHERWDDLGEEMDQEEADRSLKRVGRTPYRRSFCFLKMTFSMLISWCAGHVFSWQNSFELDGITELFTISVCTWRKQLSDRNKTPSPRLVFSHLCSKKPRPPTDCRFWTRELNVFALVHGRQNFRSSTTFQILPTVAHSKARHGFCSLNTQLFEDKIKA